MPFFIQESILASKTNVFIALHTSILIFSCYSELTRFMFSNCFINFLETRVCKKPWINLKSPPAFVKHLIEIGSLGTYNVE